jgi:hypothetical protein
MVVVLRLQEAVGRFGSRADDDPGAVAGEPMKRDEAPIADLSAAVRGARASLRCTSRSSRDKDGSPAGAGLRRCLALAALADWHGDGVGEHAVFEARCRYLVLVAMHSPGRSHFAQLHATFGAGSDRSVVPCLVANARVVAGLASASIE